MAAAMIMTGGEGNTKLAVDSALPGLGVGA